MLIKKKEYFPVCLLSTLEKSDRYQHGSFALLEKYSNVYNIYTCRYNFKNQYL